MDNWLIVALLAMGILMAFLLDQFRRRHRLGAFHVDRASLETEEFASFFFLGEQVAVAEKLHALLARYVPIDIGRLRPDDRLVADWRLDELDSLAAQGFVLDVEKELGVAIPDDVAERLLTFRQVVEYVAGHLPVGASRRRRL
ncbi:acyl carrier protein [Methylomagnum sp.]